MATRRVVYRSLPIYCQELGAEDLQAASFDELMQQYKRLANAEHLVPTSSIIDLLYDNEDGNAQALLNQCINQLNLGDVTDRQLQESQELLIYALIQVEEAISGLRDYQDNLELDESVK